MDSIVTRADRLKSVCLRAVSNPDFLPKSDGTTFCNLAADYIATNMGCIDFRNGQGDVLTADEIYDVISDSPTWRTVTIGGCSTLANQGGLVFAILPSEKLNQGHGHLCAIIPGYGIFSGHWNLISPLCANVGKDVFIGKPVSYAFVPVPEFYLWKPSLPENQPPVGGASAA